MTKKDRVATVFSMFMLIAFSIGMTTPNWILAVWFFLIPVLTYWGYRFIKNDISFLKVKDE